MRGLRVLYISSYPPREAQSELLLKHVLIYTHALVLQFLTRFLHFRSAYNIRKMSETMKALRFHGKKDLRLEQVPVPKCGPGQVKVCHIH